MIFEKHGVNTHFDQEEKLMKIIVANQKEKELMMNFIRAMHDLDMFSEIENTDHSEDNVYLTTDQYRVISDNFYDEK